MGTSNVFFIGDTHFGHKKILQFEQNGRQHLFKTIEEHDEALVDNWNKVVRSRDTVYHLGDAAFDNHYHLGRLKGYKKIILGNHDNDNSLKEYFERFFGALSYKGWILTHIPVHPKQLEYKFTHNIHGHLHTNTIGDPKYINVSADVINFTPIALEDLKKLCSTE